MDCSGPENRKHFKEVYKVTGWWLHWWKLMLGMLKVKWKQKQDCKQKGMPARPDAFLFVEFPGPEGVLIPPTVADPSFWLNPNNGHHWYSPCYKALVSHPSLGFHLSRLKTSGCFGDQRFTSRLLKAESTLHKCPLISISISHSENLYFQLSNFTF